MAVNLLTKEWLFQGVDCNVQSLESHEGEKENSLVITIICGLSQLIEIKSEFIIFLKFLSKLISKHQNYILSAHLKGNKKKYYIHKYYYQNIAIFITCRP